MKAENTSAGTICGLNTYVVKLSKGDMSHIKSSHDKTPVWVNATLRQVEKIETSRRQNGDFDAAVYATKYGYRD